MNPFDRLPRRNPRHRHGKRPVPMNPRGTLPQFDVPAQVPDAEERAPATRPAWLTEFRPAAQDDAGCPVCSDLEYGVRCTCLQDCGHSLCLGELAGAETAEALASLREQIAEVAPPSFTVVSQDLLQDVLDGLRALDAPEAYAPDLLADLKELPAFRDALGRSTRRHAGECRCGHPVTGDTWGARMVRAGIHILTDGEGQVA